MREEVRSGTDARLLAQRRLMWRQAMISALVLIACIPAFVWVIRTRELSFAGSFGLFGGHWMLGVLMPVAVLALISLVHALGQLVAAPKSASNSEEEHR